MWSAGTLPFSALQGYATQYYKQVESFPRYLAGIYLNCGNDLEARRDVLKNLVEEDQGPDNHPDLWLRFAEGIDVSRNVVKNTSTLPETAACVETFERLTVEGSAVSGIAAIYAYESTVPEIAASKIAGLQDRYGIRDAQTLLFFTTHEAADQLHREWDKKLLTDLVQTESDEHDALHAAHAAANALWQLLDGCQRAYVN
jgi:pyrroloquinoline-quinone synthase